LNSTYRQENKKKDVSMKTIKRKKLQLCIVVHQLRKKTNKKGKTNKSKIHIKEEKENINHNH